MAESHSQSCAELPVSTVNEEEDAVIFKLVGQEECEGKMIKFKDGVKGNLNIKEKSDSDMDLENTSDESESPSKKLKIDYDSPKEEETLDNQFHLYRDQQSFPNNDSDEDLPKSFSVKLVQQIPLPETEEGEIISDLGSSEDSPRQTGGFENTLFIEKVPFSTSILTGGEELKDESEKIEDGVNDPEQHNKSLNKSTEEDDDIYNDLPINVNISPSYYNDPLLDDLVASSTASDEKNIEQECGIKTSEIIMPPEDFSAVEGKEETKQGVILLSSPELEVDKTKERQATKHSSDDSESSDDDAAMNDKKNIRKEKLQLNESDSDPALESPAKVRNLAFSRYRRYESSDGKTSDSDYSSTTDEDKLPLPKESHKTYIFHKRGKKDKKKRDEIEDDNSDDDEETEIDHLEIVAPLQAGVREQKLKALKKDNEPASVIKSEKSKSPRDEQPFRKRHDYDKKERSDGVKDKKSTKYDESKYSKYESGRYDEDVKEKEQMKIKSRVSSNKRTEIQEDEDLRTKLLQKRSRREEDYYEERYEHRDSRDYYESRERTRQPYYEKDYKGSDYRTVEKDYKGSDKEYRTVDYKDKKGMDKDYKGSVDRNYRGTEKFYRNIERDPKGADRDFRGTEKEYKSKSYWKQKDDKYLEKRYKHSKEPKKKDKKREKDRSVSAKGDSNKKKKKLENKSKSEGEKHAQIEVDSDSDSPVETESFKRKSRGAEDELKLEKSDSDSENDLEYDDISSVSSGDLSPPPLPVEQEKPTYYPAIQGCRSVEEFSWLNRIEEGTYGVVYRAKDRRTDDIVALKRLKMEREREGFPITSLREINTLLKAQHVNIVTVREIVVGSNMDKIYIVMDYVEHDLKALMETMTQPFLVGEVKTLMIQLLRGVQHLHDSWILHRDIKASNLLLSHKGILKIGDFGLAREYGSPLKQYTPVVVTLWYRAPELLLGAKEYSTAVDLWSVGCVFVELLTMKPLFPGKSEIDLINRIFKELGTPSDKIWPGPPAYSELNLVKKMQFVEYPYNSLRQRFGASLTDKGFNLMNRFLTYDPKKRITGEGAINHEYFEEAPLPVDPSMFPTWPAKSELGHSAVRKRHMASPQAPIGGAAASQLAGEDGKGFHMPAPSKGTSAKGTGFNLKF